ncbi:MAG: hypothetical protein PHD20_02775 [Clostridia bacterium]|nr:hypothetical protein [Clostridia bacterium]
MQDKGKEFGNLLRETRRVWGKIPGEALEEFYQAINNSDKYTDQEKEMAKEILLG